MNKTGLSFLTLKQQCHYGILRRTVEKISESEDYDSYEMVRAANQALVECDEIDRLLDIYDKLKEKKCE